MRRAEREKEIRKRAIQQICQNGKLTKNISE